MVPGPGGAWRFPDNDEKGNNLSGGLIPSLTNVKRICGVTTYSKKRNRSDNSGSGIEATSFPFCKKNSVLAGGAKPP